MMIKKIKPWLFTILLLSTVVAFALEVAIEEVEKASTSINFVNFSGEVTENESAEQIRDIGRDLARLANFDSTPYTINNKYSMIEVTNNNNDNLYSAAILSIDPNARVDHIRNVRQITAGYLQAKYNYNAQEANTLAYFLSFYNAVYRGNIAYLTGVYKPEVFNFIDQSNAGIATNYRDWPGKTRFIIPLTATSSIRISELDGMVTSAARENSTNLAVDQRENLTGMKEDVITQNQQQIKENEQALANSEEELKQAAEQAEKDRAAAQQANEKANQATKSADEAKKNADEAQKQANEAKENGDPDAIAKQQAADKAKEEAEKAKEEAEKAKDDAEQQSKQSEQSNRENEQKQQAVEQKKNETEDKKQENQKLEQQVADEKKRIEQDKVAQAVRANPEKAAAELSEARSQLEGKSPFVGDKFFYMDVSARFQGGHYKNKVLAIDPTAGTIMTTSSNNICSKDFIAYGKGVVVVTATDDSHNSGHSLSLLNIENLQPLATTPAGINIYWSSFIHLDGGKIYAIVVGSDKQFYLARFNDKMELESQSVAKVDGDTSITINKDKIYVNLNGRKQIVVLNKSDLTTVSEIKLT